MLVATFPLGLYADTVVTEGDFTFLCNTDKGTATLNSYVGSASNVSIPSTVKVSIGGEKTKTCTVITIGNGAFQYNTTVTSVTAPSSLTKIGSSAFSSCTRLASFSTSAQLSEISSCAFGCCSSLTNFSPSLECVTSIGDYAFEGCGKTSFGEMHLGAIVSIGNRAFSGCNGLRSVSIANTLKTMGTYAFAWCYGLERMDIDGTDLVVPYGAFYDDAKLSAVSFGDGVVSINSNDWHPFTGCTNIVRITIGAGMTKISPRAFYGASSLESFDTTARLTEIGSSAFSGHYKLKTFSAPNAALAKIESSAFSGCSSLTNFSPSLEQVTSIGSCAFQQCTRMPWGDMDFDAKTTIDSQAFSRCDGIKSIHFGRNVVSLSSAMCFGLCSNLSNCYFDGAPPAIVQNGWQGAFYRTSASAHGHYPAACATEWQAVIDPSTKKWQGLIMEEIPAPVLNAPILNDDESSIDLAWSMDYSSANLRFDVYRSASSDFASASVVGEDLVSKTFKDETWLQTYSSGVTLYYWVVAKDGDCEIGRSNDESANIPIPEMPEAPKACDVLFVASSPIGYLGSIQDNRQTISIPLTIRRCFGDIAKLLDRSGGKGLPSRVELVIVSTKGNAGSVSFNGEDLSNGVVLPSAKDDKDVWQRVRYMVDTESFRSPSRENPSAAGVNDITVTIDGVDNESRARIAWASLYVPAPPPIVVIHGINDSAYKDRYTDGISDFADAIAELGLPVSIATTLGHHGWDGIKKGAEQVRTAVTEAKNKFHVDHVNLVCHSMGGLKARQYVEDADDVLSIFQIATPNGGSCAADIGYAFLQHIQHGGTLTVPFVATFDEINSSVLFNTIFGEDLSYVGEEALHDLTTAFLKRYNSDHPLCSDVNYRVLAGSEDIFAPKASAHTMVPHYLSSPISGASHTSLVVGEMDKTIGVICEDILSVAVTNSAVHAGISQALPLAGIVSDKMEYDKYCRASLADKDYFAALLSKAEPNTVEFGVSESGPIEVCLSAEEPLAWTLISPSGSVCDSDDANVEVVDTNGLQVVTFNAAEAGIWSLQLSTSGETNLCMVSIEEKASDLSCDVSIEEDTIRAGEDFIIYASASNRQCVLDMTPVVECCTPDGEKISSSMTKVGNRYSAIVPSSDPGVYSFMVSCVSTNGTCFSRKRFFTGKAGVASRFDGSPSFSGVDFNTNGLFDVLRATFSVASSSSAVYRVKATLADANDVDILSALSTNVYLAVGAGSVTVDFDGESIFASKSTPPYRISSAQLIIVSGDCDEVTDATNFMSQADFSYYKYEHSRNWNVDDAIPELPEATSEVIAEILDDAQDAKIKQCITNATSYNAYREWASVVKGTNGTAIAGANAVKNSPTAWVSYALGSAQLLEKAPTDDDLTVEKFEPASEAGKFDFTVSVDGVNVGSDAQKENLKQVFGLEGSTTLKENDFSSSKVDISFGTPENGKVKFTAGPNSANADSGTFFMKVKVTP